MVKALDDSGWPPLLDHVGWLLWQATERWRAEFAEGMIAHGYTWAGEARANVLPHIGREGIAQAELAPRMGLSKQAVQQLLDQLETDGVIERRADPQDKRGRLVVFTRTGRRYLADANAVKQAIEARYRAKLGEKRFQHLTQALRALEPEA